MSLRAFVELLAEEMAARHWTSRDVALRRVLHDLEVKQLELDLLLAVPGFSDKELAARVIVSPDTLDELAAAFGVSYDFFRNVYEDSAS